MTTKNFNQGTQKLKTKNTPYYHGSATKITGGYLKPREQFNSVQNARVVGAFVTCKNVLVVMGWWSILIQNLV